jgi:hypothetical protein
VEPTPDASVSADKPIQLGSRAHPRRRGVDVSAVSRQAFASGVVDTHLAAEAAAVGKRIRQEVEAPALVRPLRKRQRDIKTADNEDDRTR